ncbi:MAG TPA: SGNH/GDSL hydrolase family protein [Longimicrobium sp.]|jgi:lysophospholipase L1-like esterase
MRLSTSRRLLALAALPLLALGACVGDGDDLLTEAPAGAAGGALFERYVALGNSITAGFQSGGIVDSLQARAYPVLLSQRAGNFNFGIPWLAKPGCPAPFTAPFTPQTGVPACALRVADPDSVPTYVQNLAVPGVRIADLFAIPSGSIAQLYTLVTGGRTQVQAMIDAEPTFVSVWIGNNDALNAVASGVLGPLAAGADSNLTRLAPFQARVTELAGAINASGAQGAALVGVVNAIQFAPIVQPGAFFFLARDVTTRRFNGKLVNDNCSPVNNLGQPNPLAANLVSFQAVTSTAIPEINCDPAQQGGLFLLDQTEIAVITARINAYNAALQAAAAANNWVYVDPNTIFAPQLTTRTSGRTNQIRKCIDLATATTAAQFQAAVLNTCPVTGATAAPNLFGALISLDAVHPSSAAHVLFANALAAAINARYGTTLATS